MQSIEEDFPFISKISKRINKLYTNIEKSKNDKLNYAYKVLNNGLQILFVSDPEANNSSAALSVGIGYLSDKPNEQGLAHFCEHLLFMGTEKYPEVNDYKEYLAKNDGDSNAFTKDLSTTFFFSVSNEGFEGALDRFAQFFISPVFNTTYVEKEINAIDSENNKNLTDDGWRINQLVYSESAEGSCFRNFGTGNKETLNIPDIRDRLLKMYNMYYTSEVMALCVYSKKPLGELIEFVEKLFIKVPSRENYTPPKYYTIPPYDKTNTGMFYKITPLKDVNHLKFYWFLPYENDYQIKPIYYIAALFGHEGPNSLTSSLYKDNLINELVTSNEELGEINTIFTCDISLTEKGLKNYKEVINRVLKFIKKIQSQPVNERYFNENKKVHKLGYDFQNKVSPGSYTLKYAQSLHKYEPEDVIIGPYLIKKFDEPVIRKYLDLLTIDNLNIYFISKTVESECNLTEKWYGTKYAKEKINITQLTEEIEKYECKHNLDYPPVNKFLPKSIDILPFEPREEKNPKIPEKILDENDIKLWFLQDSIFKRPKAIIGGLFELPDNLCNFSEMKNSIIKILLSKIIKNDLGETLYMGREAGVNFSFDISSSVSLTINGYNDAMYEGLKEIITFIKNLEIKETHQEYIDLFMNNLIKGLSNSFMGRSISVNISNLKTMLSENANTSKELLDWIKENPITLEDVALFKKNLFKRVKATWLIQGNINKETALNIVKMTNETLGVNQNCINDDSYRFKKNRTVKIKDKFNFVYRVKSKNVNDKDSSVICTYILGFLKTIEEEYLGMIDNLLSEEFFNQLRTKESLGYIVQQSLIVFGRVIGYSSLVQGNKQTPEQICNRIKQFFFDSHDKIKKVTDDDIKNLVDNRVQALNSVETNLNQLFGENWAEISNETYEFDNIERQIDSLKKVTKEGLIDFYEKYFLKEPRIIETEYVCEEMYSANEEDLKENQKKDYKKYGIEKRILVDSIKTFRECNELYPNFVTLRNNGLFEK